MQASPHYHVASDMPGHLLQALPLVWPKAGPGPSRLWSSWQAGEENNHKATPPSLHCPFYISIFLRFPHKGFVQDTSPQSTPTPHQLTG